MTNNLDSASLQSMVKQFLEERFDIAADNLTSDTAMRDLGLDSIMMLDVMLEVEDRLGIKLTDLSMPANPKLGDLVALIQRNMAGTP
jgi:acyl carrier protein